MGLLLVDIQLAVPYASVVTAEGLILEWARGGKS
jgi:hypothetical protein